MNKQRGFYFVNYGPAVAFLLVLAIAVGRYGFFTLGLSHWASAALGAGAVLIVLAAIVVLAVWHDRRQAARVDQPPFES